MRWYTQVTEDFANESDAKSCFDHLAEQVDFNGGRIIPPSPAKPAWRVQTFHDAPESIGDPGLWLPDGMRVVAVPDSARARLGFRS